MTNRITRKTLEAIAARINAVTNSPMEPHTMGADGKYHAAIGNFHISGSYGGYALHRMVTDGGGVTDVFNVGHQSARNMADRMYAFVRGLEFAEQGV
jgi:hypothetical protein